MAGLGNLLQNKLFMQLLGAAGQDLQTTGTIGPNLNTAVLQNISAQNADKMRQKNIKMLAAMLRGEIPEGGSMTMKSGDISLKLPKGAVSLEGFDPLGRTQTEGGTPATGLTPSSSNSNLGNPSQLSTLGLYNPFL